MAEGDKAPSAFFSYAHKSDKNDRGKLSTLRERLESEVAELLGTDFKIFQDREDIKWGDDWQERLQTAADDSWFIIPVITERYFKSEVCRQELDIFIERERKGRGKNLILPLLYNDSTTLSSDDKHAVLFRKRQFVDWRELRLVKPSSKRYQEALSRLANDLHGAIQSTRARTPDDEALQAATALVLAVLRVDEFPDRLAKPIADELVQRLAFQAQASRLPLLKVVRFCLEHYLLRSDGSSFVEFQALASEDRKDRACARFDAALHNALGKAFQHETDARFFSRFRDREKHWKAYFDALRKQQNRLEDPSDVGSLDIRVEGGHIAAQHLVAGLLARFDDNWSPVLETYRVRVEGLPYAFSHLQATQWNCWLVWGPSIPVCKCDSWKGITAMQYGYGDENNSVPVLLRGAQDWSRYLGLPGTSPRATVTGRLRWAPDHWKKPSAPWRKPLAPRRTPSAPPSGLEVSYAQRALCESNDAARYSEALVLEATSISEAPARSEPEYFSAYIWLMFFVGTRSSDARLPNRLNGTHFPSPEDLALPATNPEFLMDGLWRGLLPVFVHANLADPTAFKFQQKVLVTNAVQLLRELWTKKDESFRADDVKKGIQFCLTSASDYSGCGCSVRHPATPSLLDLLREEHERLVETEPDLAEAILLPDPAETYETRNPVAKAFLSACQMPDLVRAYYRHVDDNMRELEREA